MKYGNITKKEAIEFAENGKVVYGCDYRINDNNLNTVLMQKPVKGTFVKEIKNIPSGTFEIMFVPLNKQGQPRKSGHIWYGSRHYADTYEESVEIFNALVKSRQNKLEKLIKELQSDYIKE